MEKVKKWDEFSKKDDKYLIDNAGNELLSGSFTISRVQRVLRVGYNRALGIINRAIEAGVLVRPEGQPNAVMFSDKVRDR